MGFSFSSLGERRFVAMTPPVWTYAAIPLVTAHTRRMGTTRPSTSLAKRHASNAAIGLGSRAASIADRKPSCDVR